MENYNQSKLYYDIMLPLQYVLADVEINGLKIDRIKFETMEKEAEEGKEKCQIELRDLTGDSKLNPNSPKQLSNLLFEELKLNPVKRTAPSKTHPKGNPSTDFFSCTLLNWDSKGKTKKILDEILKYRSYAKLHGTYLKGVREGKKKAITPYWYIHPGYYSLLESGRLSADKIQTFSRDRGLTGMTPRDYIIPSNLSSKFVSFDWKQMELRYMAIFCQDEVLMKIFDEGGDPHRFLASKIFDTPEDEITPEQRQAAKTTNFQIGYGSGADGLFEQFVKYGLKTTKEECGRFIQVFWSTYPQAEKVSRKIHNQTIRERKAITPFGRTRFFPNGQLGKKEIAEIGRKGFSHHIQSSTTGDFANYMILKMEKMIQNKFKDRIFQRIFLHDGFVYEVPETLLDSFIPETTEILESPIPEFGMPYSFPVEYKIGNNWGEIS